MSQICPDATAPDLDLIERLSHEAISTLPPAFRVAATAIRLRIEDFAPPDILDTTGITDPFELTGLYDGIPLTEKTVSDPQLHPDTVWLFRRAILDEWADRGNVSLRELVSHVLVHELAHHFGWSDGDIAAIDPWWE
jgi:predicted Zn-dependent protease with MMP-like domain